MPKKKKPARRATRPAPGLSPLRTGGRALGELQVAYRTFLETEEDAAVMDPGDLEARLMESLGWLLIDTGEPVEQGSATRFHPAQLRDLFTELVPAVAEHNGLDAQELVDEVRVAWTTYLMFLGESGAWRGDPEELADCLDVASGGIAGSASGQRSVLDALESAALAVPAQQALEDLRSVPVVTAALRGLEALRAGIPVGGEPVVEGPAVEALRAEVGDVLDPVALWLDWSAAGVVEVVDGRTHVPGPVDALHDVDARRDVAAGALASAVTAVLASSTRPAAVVGGLSVVTAAVLDPMTTPQLRAVLESTGDGDELPAALETVAALVDLGVLSAVEPWTARPGLAGAVLDVVSVFFGEHDREDEDVDPDEGEDPGEDPGGDGGERRAGA
ncbi:hypothetical protein [Kineococcus gypseus]|uniref:hypothetical protein n=1 Tax=Kineococcus gypseus TaxID=1637102 RepID=UPI003D7DE41A